jgi:Fur family ferric uptake transcriptional regulator
MTMNRSPSQSSGQPKKSSAEKSLTKTLPCGRPAPAKTRSHQSDFEAFWKEKLEQYLTTKELNQSDSRNKLIEIVLERTGHFTVQELIRWVSEKHPKIGVATIYRNIPVLVDAGFLKETLTNETGQMYYEVAGDDHHDHIVCMDCNEIFEFNDEGIEDAQDRVSKDLGFQPVKHRHVIFAACGYREKNAKRKTARQLA